MAYLQGVLFLVVTVSLGLVRCCNDYAIEQCANAFTSSVGEGPLKTEAEITGVCNSEYPTFHSCIAPHKSGCSIQVRALFEGLDNLYEYVCNEGKSDAAAYNPCLSRTELQSDIKSCESTMTSRLNSNRYASHDTKCGYIDDYLDCVKQAAKDECGADAAEFQDKSVRLTVGPLLESVDCGCSAITAMMWLVGGALLLQWLIR